MWLLSVTWRHGLPRGFCVVRHTIPLVDWFWVNSLWIFTSLFLAISASQVIFLPQLHKLFNPFMCDVSKVINDVSFCQKIFKVKTAKYFLPLSRIYCTQNERVESRAFHRWQAQPPEMLRTLENCVWKLFFFLQNDSIFLNGLGKWVSLHHTNSWSRFLALSTHLQEKVIKIATRTRTTCKKQNDHLNSESLPKIFRKIPQ